MRCLGRILAGVGVAIGSLPCAAVGQLPQVGSLITTIGSLDSPEEEVFGEITDVVLGEDRTLHVLDELNGTIRSFTTGGEFLGTFGQKGRGPGEFMGPLSADRNGAGTLYVSDGDNLRLSMISWRNGGLNLDATVRLESFPMEVCVLGDRMMTFQFIADGPLVTVLSLDGAKIGAFARREPPRGALALIPGTKDHLLYSATSLACEPTVPSVVIAQHRQPIIRAFTPNGELAWRAELEGFHETGYATGPTQRCCVASIPDPSTGTYETVWSVVPDGRGQLLVSIEEYRPETRERTYEHRLLSAATGEELARDEAPGIAVLIRDGLLVSKVRAPVPQVLVHAWLAR